ncbi:MAG: S8 family peptidase [Peptostreptococcaceae bacterium]
MDNIEIKLIPTVEEIQELNSDIINKASVTAGISMINAPYMWAKNYTGKGIVIAVIDTGCSTKHIALQGQIIGGRNFTTEDNSNPDIYEDYNGHGTHVCGTIAAKATAQGVVGIAPDSKLLVLKVLDKNGSGRLQSIIDAINYAVSKNVDIISMSLGGKANDINLYNAIKTAVSKEILVVCASGNEGDNNPDTYEYAYPGSYNEIISVGAIDNNKLAARFTNSNKEVDLVAPGVNILSTYLDNKYKILSGTSMATPHVSGALALIKQWSREEFKRDLSEVELYAQLIKNTTELNIKRTLQGNGMLYLKVLKL